MSVYPVSLSYHSSLSLSQHLTTMRSTLWGFFLNLMIMQSLAVFARKTVVVEKAESRMPVLSPPEGNTTFLGGTTWCVARPGAPQAELKIALDWACGLGKADCRRIQPGGPCFQPETLMAHASYAFNNYYQQNGNSDIACYFGGTAALTRINPSFAKCSFASSGSIKSSSASSYKFKEVKSIWWKITYVVIVFLYLSKR